MEANTARQVSDYLQDLFVAPDPWTSGGGELSARDLLDRGREKIDQELAGQPELRARLLMILGRTYHGLGAQEIAGAMLTEAVELAGEPAVKMESLRALSWWHRDQHDTGSAIESARQALVISESEFGPDSAEAATDLAYLGAIFRDAGRYDEAAPLLERSVTIREEKLGPDHLDLGWSLFHLGWLRHLEEKDDEADELYQRACKIMETELGSEHPAYAICLGDWAKVLASMGELETAREKLEQSLAIRKTVFPDGHPETANCRTDLGYLLWRMGDIPAAGKQYEEAYRMRRRLLGETHLVTLKSMTNLALVHERMGRPDEAERLSRERLKLAREHYGPTNQAVIPALYSHSSLLVRLGRINEAIAGHRELVTLLPLDRGDTRRAAGVRYSLVSLLVEPDQAEEVLTLIEEIETVLAERPELTYPPRAGVLFYKARALMLLGRDAEAIPLLEESIELQTAATGESNFRVAESTWLLGLNRWREGGPDEGNPDMVRGAEILGKVQGENGLDFLLYRSILLAAEGKQEEAADALKAAMENGLPAWKLRLQRNLHPDLSRFPG